MQKTVINQMPAPTWNRLGVNYAEVKLPENIIAVIPEYTDCSNTCIKYIDSSELKKKLKSFKRIGAEKFVAGKKEYIRFEDNLTALGKDLDDYLIYGLGKALSINITAEKSDTTLVFKLHYTEENQGIILFIDAEENAKQSIIFDITGSAENAFLSVKTNIKNNADISFGFIQTLDGSTSYYQDFSFVSGDSSSVKFIEAQLGAKKVCGAVRAELIGYRAEYKGKTSYFGRNEDELDLLYNIIHGGKKGTSEMLYNGVLDGFSKKTFKGVIDFRNESEGSKGNEQENVLLLNENVLNNSLPVILCEVEDLDGCHGASIGKLDEKTLFYFESRGVNKKSAERMMVESRLLEAVREIDEADIRAKAEEFIKKLY